MAVNLDLQTLLNQVGNTLPRELDADGAWTEVGSDFAGVIGLKYKVWRDEPTISISGNTVTLAMTLYYHAAISQRVRNGIIVGGYSWNQVASCGYGEPAPQVHINISLQLTWQDDYHLGVTGKRNSTYTTCKVTALNIDVTPRIQQFVDPRTNDAMNQLVNLIHDTDFRTNFVGIWSAIQTLVPISGPVGDFSLNPQSLAVAPLAGAGTNLSQTFILSAAPSIIPPLASSPPSGPGVRSAFARSQPPPTLKLQQPSFSKQFQVTVDDRISFATATTIAKQQLDGKNLDCLSLRCTVTVLEVGGIWQMAYVKLLLSGDMQGTVYLTGDMKYDAATAIFSIQNLRLTADEVSAFTAAMINTMQDPAFLKSIQDRLQWKVTGNIESVRTQINSKISNVALGGGYTLYGNANGVQPIYVTAFPKDCPPVFDPASCAQIDRSAVFYVMARVTGTLEVH